MRFGNQMVLGWEGNPRSGGAKFHTVQIQISHGQWKTIPVKELMNGNLFKVFDADTGKLVKDLNGFVVFKALSTPEMAPPSFWVVRYTGVEKEGA